ncbi:MAG: type III-B CRISPR module RAMP protein Cmr4 [Ignavibacteria bacterium]|jgi:CRISPR-associated protein Cmr4|nr:type III-B CRISPR module RAMP protein Cmr4 [Ignavibacteria bacterium]MDH7528809.1 type III-B CRISPR module RAMP protein Cmr4 [Ignavibacteria bacterium]
MFKKIKPFFIIVETPLHAGSGSELGIVDLPIQRERHTDYPKIEGSGLKGSLREAFNNLNPEIEINSLKIRPNDKIEYTDDDGEKFVSDYLSLVFGPEDGNTHAGSIAFTDARILLFPVKSLKGIFAWITCPDVLERFKNDLKLANFDLPVNNFSSLGNTCCVSSEILVSSKVVLEEFTFSINPNDQTTKLAKWLSNVIFPKQNGDDPYGYWRNKIEKDLIILPNDDFRDFVVSSTEIITRTKINSTTGTVDNHSLWTEEYLPTDTILYSLVLASPLRIDDENKKGNLKHNNNESEAQNVLNFFQKGCPRVLQIGGDQTIGKGIVTIQFLELKEDEK